MSCLDGLVLGEVAMDCSRSSDAVRGHLCLVYRLLLYEVVGLGGKGGGLTGRYKEGLGVAKIWQPCDRRVDAGPYGCIWSDWLEAGQDQGALSQLASTCTPPDPIPIRTRPLTLFNY